MNGRLLALFLVLISVMLMGAGCGQQIEAPTSGTTDTEKEQEEEMKNWAFDVETEKREQELLVHMTLENLTEQEKNLDFSSGQIFELILKDSSGETVYRFSDGKMFTMAIVQQTYGAGESQSFSEAVDISQLESGTYSLKAEIVAASIDGKELKDKEEFTASVEVEI